MSAVRHGAVRGNGVFSGRNVQFGLTHPEKPAYSRMIMENQKGFVRHRSLQIRQPAVLSKLRSSAQGLLRLLSATTTKTYRKLNRPTKGAHIKNRLLYMKSWILVDRMQNNRNFTLSRQSLTLRDLRRSCAQGICSLRSHMKTGSIYYFKAAANSNNSSAITGLLIRIRLSSSFSLDRRVMLPYQTSDLSMIAKRSRYL